MIKGVSAEKVEQLIAAEKETRFLIVDVREDKEYRLDHIPGAAHIPLSDIRSNPEILDRNRHLVFYCRNESRSKVAALFATDAGYDERNLSYLEGGMAAYAGEILLEAPRVDLLDHEAGIPKILMTAFEFEKGAYYFYTTAIGRFKGSGLFSRISRLAKDEVSHARVIYNHMPIDAGAAETFDAFFTRCKGNILEGGTTWAEVEAFLSDTPTAAYMDVLEFAVELEFSAYDLYKNAGERTGEPGLKEMFHQLAQAEKKHLHVLVDILAEQAS